MRGQKKPAATNAAGSTVLIWVINYFCKLFGKLGFVELIIPCTTAKRQELFAPVILLSCRIQHILYKNSVSPRRVSHQYMSHRANQLSVLDDGTAAHECLSLGTTVSDSSVCAVTSSSQNSSKEFFSFTVKKENS